MAISLADLYKYAKLSTAGYVDLTGATSFIAEELRDRASRQARMPVALGSQFFTLDGWTVLGDPRHPAGSSVTHNSPSGLAATLFSNTKTGEKVLSVRGTEGSAGIFSSTFLRDLQADVAEIGESSESGSRIGVTNRGQVLQSRIGVKSCNRAFLARIVA